jgi:hypothetical protein
MHSPEIGTPRGRRQVAKSATELKPGQSQPVWGKLSDFGFPFPPFSFDGGKWTRDIDSDKAKQFGILSSEKRAPVIPSFKSVF